MINIFLFLSLVFLLIFFVGRFLESIRIPWIFSALLLGAVLSVQNSFDYITGSPIFLFLSNLGMYFLLFIIGFEINLNKIKNKKLFILGSAFLVIFLEAFLGGLFIHFFFHYSWLISFIVALSFATVGEAILVPILDEFKIINSELGQTILGIGTLDDVVEVLILIAVILFVGSNLYGEFNIWLIVMALLGMFTLTYGLKMLKTQNRKFNFIEIESLFFFIIAILFLFLGIGEYAQATALGAILAGIGIRNFIPKKRLAVVEGDVKALCYGLFAPIFFLWAGLSLDLGYLFSSPILVLLLVGVSSGAKYIAGLLAGYKKFGLKKSILLGTALSVRFSTSIVVVKILYENNVIENKLYSVIVASSIIFTFVVPLLFSELLKKFALTDYEKIS